MLDFPDERSLLAVRIALWAGRAAVLVGAGFSRNADPDGPGARPFPVWRDLLGGLLDELHPDVAGDPDRRRDTLADYAGASGALRLAEEYEAAFGRSRLDDYLLAAVPDGDHRPGLVHRLLLGLPWADVLTTNYDTLLERAARTTPRRYDVVRTPEEMPRATRPRVVKLHGSFPAHRPFVFTEEDFRTYPRRFALFVNLAQQAAAENTLCLLGFSGDDPNFLVWTGWVRDHLGPHTPPAYLCGILHATDAQRRVLARRNVTVVDLAPVFPAVRFPDPARRHRLATEWLLRSFANGRPPDPLGWPAGPPAGQAAPADPDLPPTLPASGPAPVPERFFP